jgi:hypothetical protein
MQQGRGGMGSRKHGTSGVAPKSPGMRHRMKLDAEKNERKAKRPLPHKSIRELFREK